MLQSDHASELERRVQERADIVKRELREYRETLRSSASLTVPRISDSKRLRKKQLEVERANAEYMQLQKELDQVRSQMPT